MVVGFIEPSEEIWISLSETFFKIEGEWESQSGAESKVREGDLVTDKVFVILEMLVKKLEFLSNVLHGNLVGIFVEGEGSSNWSDKSENVRADFTGDPIKPLVNDGFLVWVCAIQTSGWVFSGEVSDNGVRFEEEAFLGLEGWDSLCWIDLLVFISSDFFIGHELEVDLGASSGGDGPNSLAVWAVG